MDRLNEMQRILRTPLGERWFKADLPRGDRNGNDTWTPGTPREDARDFVEFIEETAALAAEDAAEAKAVAAEIAAGRCPQCGSDTRGGNGSPLYDAEGLCADCGEARYAQEQEPATPPAFSPSIWEPAPTGHRGPRRVALT